VKQLRQSGDAVAVSVLRVLDPKEQLSEKTVSAAIDLIGTSFEDVSFIQNRDERVPGVSLFFLRSVARGQWTPELSRRIADTTKTLTVVRCKALGLDGCGKE
jgi:hypothetical protein